MCDDPEYAKAQAEKYIVPFQKGEKEMKTNTDKEEAEKRRKEEEERKARCVTLSNSSLLFYVCVHERE